MADFQGHASHQCTLLALPRATFPDRWTRRRKRENLFPMSYFLAKTDPETYSLDDLERDRRTAWDGVTNPQAVRAIRDMRPGDRVFIYHSGGVSGVVGLATVRSDPRDDPKNPKSAVVDLEFDSRLDPPAPLAEIKQSGRFADWAL